MRTYLLPIAMGRCFRIGFSAFCACLLIACGGGAGSVGLPTGSALYSTAPGSIVLLVGGTVSYTIGGGTPRYQVSSSDPSIVTVALTGNGGGYTINGVASGAAQISIRDAAGASVAIAVSVGGQGGSSALYTTAGANVTVAVGGLGTYTVGGGTAPYVVSSSNATIVSPNIAGTVLTINGVAAGSAQILVFDANGASVAIDATAAKPSSSAINMQPDGVTANVGDTLEFILSGGTPPYTAIVANPSIATLTAVTVNSTGGSFSATLASAGSTNITIVDSLGQTNSSTLTVTSASANLFLSPTALLISEDDTNNIAFKILGGIGPYTAFTSNQTVFSVSTASSVLTLGLGNSGNRCITPIDSLGNYVPYGTVQATITVVDSQGASATSVVTVQDNGQGNAGNFIAPGPHCD